MKKRDFVRLVLGVVGGLLFSVGLAGMAMAAAYPVYRRVTEREKQRIAPEILKLTEELMQ